MEHGEKSIRLVTALVECRPDGEYVPWGIKWYDGTVYPFDRIESYSPRLWALGRTRQSESWRVVVGDGTCRDICHYGNSWYVVHDPDNDAPRRFRNGDHVNSTNGHQSCRLPTIATASISESLEICSDAYPTISSGSAMSPWAAASRTEASPRISWQTS